MLHRIQSDLLVCNMWGEVNPLSFFFFFFLLLLLTAETIKSKSREEAGRPASRKLIKLDHEHLKRGGRAWVSCLQVQVAAAA